MRPKFAIVTLAVGFAIGSVWAQWRENGKIIEDTPFRKSAGKFGAMLLLTAKPDEFFEQWNKPPSPSYKPKIETLSEARRGDTVVAVVLFIGCAQDKSGNCDTEVDYRVLKPDGSLYGEQADAELWKRQPPPEGSIQAGLGYLAFRIEPDDPLGQYTLEALVRDKVAKVKLVLKETLDVNAAVAK